MIDSTSSGIPPNDGPHHSDSIDGDENRLLDIVLILARYKNLVLGLPLVVAILSIGVTFLIPKTYTATAKLLPPQQSQSNAIAILGQLGALTGSTSQALGIKNPSDIFVAMLKSRTITDAIIVRFNLQQVYDEKTLVDTRKELSQNADLVAGRDGVITVEVNDELPQRAADIANSYLEELETLTRKLAVSEAGQRRLFFENQLKQARDNLTAAETRLTKFQVDKKILNPQGQAALMISAAAGIRAQIAAKEVHISALKSFATQENPDLHRAQDELAGLRSQLSKTAGGRDDEIGDVLLSMGKAPEESAEFLRKYRDVKYYEILYELLAKQYEIARIDESKDATLIQVLDRAIPPDKKSKPKRLLIAGLTSIVVLIFTVLFVLLRELVINSLKDPRSKVKMEQLIAAIKFRKT